MSLTLSCRFTACRAEYAGNAEEEKFHLVFSFAPPLGGSVTEKGLTVEIAQGSTRFVLKGIKGSTRFVAKETTNTLK